MRIVLSVFFISLFLSSVTSFSDSKRHKVVVNSDKLVVFESDNKAVFTGKVVSKRNNIILKADKMVVFYTGAESEADGDSIKRIEAYDSVEITTQKERATGDRGYYEDGILYLLGNVKMYDKNNVITGEKFIYNEKTGKSSLVGAKDKPGNKKRSKLIIQPDGIDDAT